VEIEMFFVIRAKIAVTKAEFAVFANFKTTFFKEMTKVW
jgi:hypothetical protein